LRLGGGTEQTEKRLTQERPRGEPEQRDWLRFADKLASYRHSVRAAIARTTVKEAAHVLILAPGSLDQQLRKWGRRKKPSADCAFFLLDTDGKHRDEVMAQCGSGFIVSPHPKLTPEEALRAITDRAQKGYVSSEEVGQLVAQTDFRRGAR
jgi:hypothetical protein